MCFFLFGCIWDHYATAQTWCKTRQTGAINAKVRATKSCRNFSQWTLLISTIGPKTPVLVNFFSVWVHFGLFHYCTKLGAKWANLVQLMQKFMPRCLVRILHNERSWSTPLDPKLMFWCVSSCLGAFGTVSLLHKTCCKTPQTSAINAKVRATKSCRDFSQRTHPIRTTKQE